jgi:hypothetical protein
MAQTAQGRARAMITGLRGTSIWSEDVNNLLPFYRDILGLEVTTETPGFVVLGGVWLGTHNEVHGRNADPARHMIGLTSDDLKGDWERLKAAGVIRRATWCSCFNPHERLEQTCRAPRQVAGVCLAHGV